jgi:hypothetical protein
MHCFIFTLAVGIRFGFSTCQKVCGCLGEENEQGWEFRIVLLLESNIFTSFPRSLSHHHTAAAALTIMRNKPKRLLTSSVFRVKTNLFVASLVHC